MEVFLLRIKQLFILIFVLFFVTACADTSSTSTSKNNTSTTSSDNTSSSLVLSESSEAPETDDIGHMVETESEAIPDYLIGTWVCIQGLPDSLESYKLVISPDGSVVQEVVDTTGQESTSGSRLILSGNELTLVDDANISVMKLYYSNDQLITDNLVEGRSLFTKE